MKMINENNYQEWFVDFKDGNLSLQQEEAMFLFLEQNPQLQSEFDQWMEIDPIPVPQSKSDVQDFSHLIKNIITVDVINEGNYSDFFIAYYEGDLSAEEIKLVDEFVRKNDFLNEEFLLFSQIKMKPDLQVKMDEKDLPYKKAVVFFFNKFFYF
jgi:hypothetical protein